MVGSGGYRTSAQKAGKSAGQREQRLAQESKRQNQVSNVYRISIVPSIIKDTRFEGSPMFGICEENGTWYLTAMTLKRKESGRKDPVDEVVVNKRFGGQRPEHGLVIDSADSKKEIMDNHNIESSKRVESGKYTVDKSQWNNRFEICKVDRDNYLDFLRGQNTITL